MLFYPLFLFLNINFTAPMGTTLLTCLLKSRRGLRARKVNLRLNFVALGILKHRAHETVLLVVLGPADPD